MSQSITSTVAVPPMLWIPHQLVGAPLAYSVTLECYTEAHPTSLNYWAREDGLMIHESSKYKTTSSPDRPSYKTHMTLTIFDIQVSGIRHRASPVWFDRSKLILPERKNPTEDPTLLSVQLSRTDDATWWWEDSMFPLVKFHILSRGIVNDDLIIWLLRGINIRNANSMNDYTVR